MAITSLSDGSSWEHHDRFLQPSGPCDLYPVVPPVSLADLIPEDWLEEFAADYAPADDLALEALDDMPVEADFAAEEASEDSAAEPEPPSFAKVFHPMSPGVSMPGLAPAHDAPLAGNHLTSEGGWANLVTDSEAVEKLVSALGHFNSASRDILAALKVWQVRAASSDLIDDYCDSLREESEALHDIGTEVSEICEEVLAELNARLWPDPCQ